MIIADHAQDRGGQMVDVCRVKNEIEKQGLYLRIPGLAELDSQCKDVDGGKGYDVFNWRHPVLLGCIVDKSIKSHDCSPPNNSNTKNEAYYARFFLIKPSLGTKAIINSMININKLCTKADDIHCISAVNQACTNPFSSDNSPMWNNAPAASCELYGFIAKNGLNSSAINDDHCPEFPQYGTINMTADSSPWMYGAIRDLAAYYSSRVNWFFEHGSEVDQDRFDKEIKFQSENQIPRQDLATNGLIYKSKAGTPTKCFGQNQTQLL
jgi:hypothetical protein